MSDKKQQPQQQQSQQQTKEVKKPEPKVETKAPVKPTPAPAPKAAPAPKEDSGALKSWDATIKLFDKVELKTNDYIVARDRIITALGMILKSPSTTAEEAELIFSDFAENEKLSHENLMYEQYDNDKIMFTTAVWTILDGRVRSPQVTILRGTAFEKARLKLIPFNLV